MTACVTIGRNVSTNPGLRISPPERGLLWMAEVMVNFSRLVWVFKIQI